MAYAHIRDKSLHKVAACLFATERSPNNRAGIKKLVVLPDALGDDEAGQ